MTVDAFLLAKGFVAGLVIAAPVGPIGLLCIRRTLAHGFPAGLASGLGAAVADGFYGVLAGGGVAALSAWLLSADAMLRAFGGALLLGLAWDFWRKAGRPVSRDDGAVPEQKADSWRTGLPSAFLSTLALTLSNPLTILTSAALFGTLAPSGGSIAGPETLVILVTGIFLGSTAWWVILSGGVAILGARISERTMARIDRLSALLIAGLAIHMLARFAFG